MNNSNALAEIQSKYPNCNLLLPAATSVQINPFYKCSVMEVVADTAPNSGDIFSVGKVKTGEDRDGKAVYEEVYSPAKPLLMKLATAAGIQFHPEYTTVTRENTNTYVGKAYNKYGFAITLHQYCICPRCNHILNAGPDYQPDYCSKCGQHVNCSDVPWEEEVQLGYVRKEERCE